MAILLGNQNSARWRAETTRGTAGAGGWTSVGFMTGGSIDISEEVQLREGIGGQVQQRGGLINPEASLTIMVQSKTLLLKAIRASYPAGALAPFSIEVGNSGSGGKGYGLLGAVVNSLGVSVAVGDALSVDLGLTGMEYEEHGSAAVHALLSGDVMEWYNADATIASTDYKARSISISLDNVDQREATLKAPGSGQLRKYDDFGIGVEKVTASYSLLAPFPFAPADALSSVAASAVFTNASGETGDAVTFTLANMVRASMSAPLEAGDSVWEFGLELIGKPESLTIT